MSDEFSALLKGFRDRAGLTQEALMGKSGVAVRTIRRLERGEIQAPRADTVNLLAVALDLTPADRQRLLGALIGHPNGAESPSPDQDDGKPRRLDPFADEIAKFALAVRARWQREEGQRQVQDPFPLPVRWELAPDELMDHWANIRRPTSPGDAFGSPSPAEDRHEPLELAGQLGRIVEIYRRIPSGRLVVLGRSGSGKTILTLRFVLDYLLDRHTSLGGPAVVPVIFGVGSWNPGRTTLHDWLVQQLTRDYPGLIAPGPTGNLATTFIDSGRILPILDGFDEIATGLRRSALEALNNATLPLVLTSRPDEYAAAVEETDVLTAAAAIQLSDLSLADLSDYLPLTARKATGKAGRVSASTRVATAWDPVLSELHRNPDGAASTSLREVLATPLMVTLARTIYSDTPDHDPAELLDTDRFPDARSIEDHLLENFLPVVYRHRADSQAGTAVLDSARQRFTADRAQHWLGYLAHHLDRLSTRDLAWWRIGEAMRRPLRSLATGAPIAVVAGLIYAAVTLSFAGADLTLNLLLAVAMNTPMVGATVGLSFGFAHWLMARSKRLVIEPATIRLRMCGRNRRTRRSGTRVLIGALCGVLFGVGNGILLAVTNEIFYRNEGLLGTLLDAITDAIIYGLAYGVSAGVGIWLAGLLEAPVDIGSAASPARLLIANRRTVFAQAAVWMPVFALLVGTIPAIIVLLVQGRLTPQPGSPGLFWSITESVRIGLVSGLAGVAAYTLTATAWGQWLVFSRCWLPLTGRLPWLPVAFLEDAYQRGALRKAGAVYQFRHARLQSHLARAYVASRTR